jgi:hypothetical protein
VRPLHAMILIESEPNSTRTTCDELLLQQTLKLPVLSLEL